MWDKREKKRAWVSSTQWTSTRAPHGNASECRRVGRPQQEKPEVPEAASKVSAGAGNLKARPHPCEFPSPTTLQSRASAVGTVADKGGRTTAARNSRLGQPDPVCILLGTLELRQITARPCHDLMREGKRWKTRNRYLLPGLVFFSHENEGRWKVRAIQTFRGIGASAFCLLFHRAR